MVVDIQKMTARILIFVLFCQSAWAQKTPSMISLKVSKDSLSCEKPCNTVAVSFIFGNDSEDDILVYGLRKGGPGPAFGSLSRLCDVTHTGTGIQFALYHSNGAQEMPEYEIVDYWKRKPATKEVLDSTFRAFNNRFLESVRILKKHDTITLIREVPLENFNLKKGLYYLQFVYYCGNKTAEMLDANKIDRSKVFQGCALSTKIPFFVNHDRKSMSE